MTEDPLVAQCRERVGALLNQKWRLDALIGVGGMAAVYMATHRNGSVAAIKLLHEDVALNEEVRERFLREAYIANKVGHPGTVKVLDDDVDESRIPYLVMELLTGESLEGKAEKAGGRLSVKETLDILDQTLQVLEAAHGHGIVHRDLKPENLFITQEGQIKVLDFGIARLREDNARKTQTGMVMGTPSFMAPEQAMGRWSEVDGRTDIYAMGATAFTLLTGLPVHEAETAGEMLVAAATRPARSLARVLNNAPFDLVALVDRALSYEKQNRYTDAQTFRAEVVKVAAGLTEESASRTQLRPERQIMAPTVHGADDDTELEQELDREERERVETYDTSQNTPEEIESMAEFFTLLERALVARKQYSDDHPETKRRFTEAFKTLASGLMSCDICLAWNLSPYGFIVGDSVIWEPEPPWNRIPYQLFSDGIRTMGVAPGIDEGEFYRWLELITLDPATDLAPEDDLVTRLWDSNFEFVFFQAIDSFAEGNQEQRARYEADRKAVIEGAHAGHDTEAARAWREARSGGSAADDKRNEVLSFLGRNMPVDAEAAARAAGLNMQEDPTEDRAAAALQIDQATRALLAARIDLDVAATSERFVVAAAEAFVASAKMGRSQAVTAPLKRAVDGLSAGEPERAMDMILELRDQVRVEGKEQETQSLRDTITGEVLSPPTLLDILKGAKTLPDERRGPYLKSLTKVIECIQNQHFDAALEFLPEAPEGPIQRLLLDFLKRASGGNEERIAQLFVSADLDLGLALVRLLADIGTEAAKNAIVKAADSPHALVRIEALGHVEGAASGRIRIEMRRLLEDPQEDVRMAALSAMEKYGIAAAGPFLVLRMQDKDFLKLSPEERAQSLQALVTLNPKRAEDVCTKLLAETSMFRPEALESTREMACTHLGEIAVNQSSFRLIDEIARSSGWRTSKRIRDAANAALDRIEARADKIAAEREARRTIVAERKRKTMAGRTRTSRTTGAKKGRTTGKGKTADSKTAGAARRSAGGETS